MGGRLLSFYYSFGEYDVLVIYEAPDESTAAGMVLAATAPGHLSKVKTTVLLSAEEGMEAMRKAGEASYRAPGHSSRPASVKRVGALAPGPPSCPLFTECVEG
jgi:hypothetical protein